MGREKGMFQEKAEGAEEFAVAEQGWDGGECGR